MTTKCRKLVLLSGVSTVVKRLTLHILDTEHFGVVIISFMFRRSSVRVSAEDNAYSIHVTFEVLKAALLKIQVFWDVTPCDWCSYRHFEEPF